jgi:hypothetical protein
VVRIDEATENWICLLRQCPPPGDPRINGVNFNHEAHVRIVWGMFAKGRSLGHVIDEIREMFKAYNCRHAPGRYSETKTIFWVLAIFELIGDMPDDHNWPEFWAHVENRRMHKTDSYVPWYDTDQWRSAAAAAHFQLPMPRVVD